MAIDEKTILLHKIMKAMVENLTREVKEIESFSDEERSFYAALPTTEEQKSFLGLSPEERKHYMGMHDQSRHGDRADATTGEVTHAGLLQDRRGEHFTETEEDFARRESQRAAYRERVTRRNQDKIARGESVNNRWAKGQMAKVEAETREQLSAKYDKIGIKLDVSKLNSAEVKAFRESDEFNSTIADTVKMNQAQGYKIAEIKFEEQKGGNSVGDDYGKTTFRTNPKTGEREYTITLNKNLLTQKEGCMKLQNMEENRGLIPKGTQNLKFATGKKTIEAYYSEMEKSEDYHSIFTDSNGERCAIVDDTKDGGNFGVVKNSLKQFNANNHHFAQGIDENGEKTTPAVGQNVIYREKSQSNKPNFKGAYTAAVATHVTLNGATSDKYTQSAAASFKILNNPAPKGVKVYKMSELLKDTTPEGYQNRKAAARVLNAQRKLMNVKKG